MNEAANRLLGPDELAAITVRNNDGRSPFLIVVDHAGNAIPRALGRLGVARAELERHIAWDIGVAAVSRFLANELDATLMWQNYSRLVIDCNRSPGSETSIPEISEFTPIPGNVGLSEDQKRARVREIFRPYHDWIEAELDLRRRSPTGTIPVHGERRGLPHVEIEIRQDLIAHTSGQRACQAETVFRAYRVFLRRKCYMYDVRDNLARIEPVVIQGGCDAAKAAFFMAFMRTVHAF
jgi:predicted N-formylglutamate amidohydrolase